MRELIDQFRRKAAPVAVLLANLDEGQKKVTLVAGLSRDLVDRGLDAVKWLQVVLSIVGGRRRPTRHGPSRRKPPKSSPRPWRPLGMRSRDC